MLTIFNFSHLLIKEQNGFRHLLFHDYFSVRKVPLETEPDFTDRGYQSKLPMHARSTATQAVKNNLRITEIQADCSLILNAQKVSKHKYLNLV